MKNARVIFRLSDEKKKEIEDAFKTSLESAKSRYYKTGATSKDQDAYWDHPKSVSEWWVQCALIGVEKKLSLIKKKGGKK